MLWDPVPVPDIEIAHPEKVGGEIGRFKSGYVMLTLSARTRRASLRMALLGRRESRHFIARSRRCNRAFVPIRIRVIWFKRINKLHGRMTVTHRELSEDVRKVEFDRAPADTERRGDLLVAKPPLDQF